MVGHLGEFFGDVVGLEVQAGGEPVAGAGDGVGGFLAGALQALQQVAAALAERADHEVAGAAERERDVLALFGQRLRDLLRAVVDLRRDVVADRGDVVRKIEMHAGDGVAHLLGLADQRVALMRQRLEQAANADFVVVVGALERRHFVGDQGFELGRAGQRPFDAVAHGGDLAADGLAHADDEIVGDLFRRRELHGDAGHRLGDDAHLLRAPHHVGDDVEEHDRRQHEAGKPDHGRESGRTLVQHRLQTRQIEECQHDAARRPGDREHGGNDIGTVGGALLQAVQDLSDGQTVVIGGELAGPRVVGGEVRRTLEQVLFRRRLRCVRTVRGGLARRLRPHR